MKIVWSNEAPKEKAGKELTEDEKSKWFWGTQFWKYVKDKKQEDFTDQEKMAQKIYRNILIF